MPRREVAESRRDRMELAQNAGLSSMSLVSALAGVLVAYGAFVILAAVAGGVLNAAGVDTTDLSTNDWRELGIASGIAVGLSLLLSYLFGGYVAGRMARRAGAMNGLLVFVLGVLLAAGIGAAIGSQADGGAIVANLRSVGVPTGTEEYSAIGTFAGIGALVSILIGSLLGGLAGERWHGKLMARALDPTVGPEATTDQPEVVDLHTRDRADDDTVAARKVDVTDTTTTLDDDRERTRTMH